MYGFVRFDRSLEASDGRVQIATYATHTRIGARPSGRIGHSLALSLSASFDDFNSHIEATIWLDDALSRNSYLVRGLWLDEILR